MPFPSFFRDATSRLQRSGFFVFEDAALQELAQRHRQNYHHAQPYPHVVIDDFLPADAAQNLLSVFPGSYAPFWFDWKSRDTVHQPKKQGIGTAARLEGAHPFIHNVVMAFNSYPFIRFLETLSGIDGIIPDPHLHGGGLHQILPGGKLDIHADFNYLPKLGLYRRLNVLLYLNKGWKEEYGGNLELWDRDMRHAVRAVAPIFNRCVVFNTDRYSYHGHPEPLACPEGMTRKSIAFYYYTREPNADDVEHHKTLWQHRPERDPNDISSA